jgi:His/Glu/Gln/Arg/opine family amino acid ABC transporter permease subunit
MGYLVDPDNWQWLVTSNNARFLLDGFVVNVQIAIIAMVFSLIAGLALALARLSRNRVLRLVAGTWIDVWRNLPLIFVILYLAIASLDRGQSEAAAALGLSYWQRMRIVILPQGLRRMLPATVSQLITLNKDTTLVSIIGIQEVVRHGRILTGFNFFGGVPAPLLQVFIVIGLMFVVTNLALSRLSRRLEIRERERTGTTVQPVSGLEDQVATVQAR